MQIKTKPDIPGMLVAAGLLALAGLIWWDTTRLAQRVVYGVGPDAAPKVVAIGLALLAVANFAMALRGALPARKRDDWRPLVFIVGGMLALMAILSFGGGYILATAVLFTATAAAFGRRAIVADFIIGLVVGVVTYLLFAKLLTLSLPVGPLESLI
ncbi:tripartite tricarboxylate transporter TctB family protein [Aquabacter sp. CN5-332]|uniref:tripartite tricarboxylate transporter TctB family protein n=1 Tax=Aquabacter sp. CN5-332 TaxID=3156608 RepID=UPI0032B3CF40